MTRKCLIIRQQKRLRLVNKYVDERILFKNLLNLEILYFNYFLKEKEIDNYLSLLILMIYQKTLFNKYPKDSGLIRLKNRCSITGRSRGFIKKWGISRIIFRELTAKGLLPGIIKSSW